MIMDHELSFLKTLLFLSGSTVQMFFKYGVNPPPDKHQSDYFRDNIG